VTRLALLVALGVVPAGAGALEDARALVELGPRTAATPGGDQAQAWVAERLLETGLAPQRLRGAGGAGAVLGCTGPSDGAGWLLAHTDVVHPACPGAVDNAAAVGVALAVAARLVADPPAEPVCVVFPDGEELGLRGARTLARRSEPAWVLALELLGQGELTAMGLGPDWGTPGLRWASDAGLAIPWAYRVYARLFPGQERSDHGPFASRGVPGLLVLGRSDAGIYWPYHTPQDGLHQLEPARLDQAVDTAEGLLRQGPPPRVPGPAVQVPGTGWVLPGWAVLGLCLLGIGSGAAVGWRGLGAALRGLGWSTLAAAVGGACWMAGVHGRVADAALATPGLLAWAAGAAAALGWAAHRPTAGRGGALLAAGLAAAALSVDAVLALPLGIAAGALALSTRWPPAALLALPLPLYLTSPATWRELVFHGVVPGSPLPWLPVLALVWAPVICAWQALGRRPPRGLAVGLALALTGWAALAPAHTDLWPVREALWPR